jgi:hypothetical protein
MKNKKLTKMVKFYDGRDDKTVEVHEDSDGLFNYYYHVETFDGFLLYLQNENKTRDVETYFLETRDDGSVVQIPLLRQPQIRLKEFDGSETVITLLYEDLISFDGEDLPLCGQREFFQYLDKNIKEGRNFEYLIHNHPSYIDSKVYESD